MKRQILQNGSRRLRELSKRLGLSATAITVIGFTVLISCTTMTQLVVTAPEIPGAEYIGNEQCAMCHEETVKRFPLSAHSRLVVADAESEVGSPKGVHGCEACHGPGSKHAEAGGGKGVFIVNPTESAESCYRCHMDKKAEFSLPYHHPVPEGKMSCTDCHDPHGKDSKKPGSLLMARVNDSCSQCHKEQTHPKVFEHEALREGCTVCHNPHGSINKKQLIETDNNLCLKCHAQVQTSSNVYIGGSNHTSSHGRLDHANCWSAGCHTAIHGSNVNDHMRY